MNDERLKVRASKAAGELEIEGPSGLVAEWWEKLWPLIGGLNSTSVTRQSFGGASASVSSNNGNSLPEVFGEYFTEFRSDITDVDKILVAAAFIQSSDPDRVFSTGEANQALLDQNIKVSNASQNVRRLIATKRAFVVSDGKYRVSAGGLDHLASLKQSN